MLTGSKAPGFSIFGMLNLLKKFPSLPVDQPWVMGIVNLTPDSFSGDGCVDRAAIAHAESQLLAGADILDLGAESSRPGAEPVGLEDEWLRLEPVLSEVMHWGVPVSLDTYKPEIMRRSLDFGVHLINDIAALRMTGALEVVAQSDCVICLMHMQGEPRHMQESPQYEDVVQDVWSFLQERVQACEIAGIQRERLILDPGFGFGKTLVHNQTLFQGMHQRILADLPLLVGVSRKRMLGEITGRPVSDRVVPSVVAAVMAAVHGARIVRVHDVAATVDGLKIWSALKPV